MPGKTSTPPDSPLRRRLCALFGLSWLAALSAGSRGARAAEAEFRVIVHPSNSERALGREALGDMFLKKVTRWSDGEAVRPVDLRAESPVRQRFSAEVLKRSVGAVRSYWQQRIFSGRDVPPPELDSEDAVIAFVARFPGAVGYVSRSAKLQGVAEVTLR